MNLRDYLVSRGITPKGEERIINEALPDELTPLSEEKIPMQTIGEIFDMLKTRYKHMPSHIQIYADKWPIKKATFSNIIPIL
jgi:hypothetical protein